MTPRFIALTFTALLTATLGACGGGIAGSCDFRAGSANGPEPRCQEWTNSPTPGLPDTYKVACDQAKGKYGRAGCPRDGIVVGCQLTAGDGSKVNNWYFPPTTVDKVKTDCTKDKGTFVTP